MDNRRPLPIGLAMPSEEVFGDNVEASPSLPEGGGGPPGCDAMSDGSDWYYLDSKNYQPAQEFGPFSSTTMRKWYMQGHFAVRMVRMPLRTPPLLRHQTMRACYCFTESGSGTAARSLATGIARSLSMTASRRRIR